MDMFESPVVYVDIETTGGSSIKNRIIEVGAIRVEDGIVTDELKSYVNPGMPIPYWITNITGITDADVVGSPYFEDIADRLNTILSGAIFIAHNVRFDFSFIKRQLEACGYNFNPKLLCTVRLSRALYPENKGHSLEKIIARHKIQVEARHRAYDDAKAIKDFSELAFAEHGEEIFRSAVAKQFKTKTLPPKVHAEVLNNVDNQPGVYIFEDERGTPIYIGKSINLRKRLLSHFSSDNRDQKEMKLSLSAHNIKTIPTENELEALLLESKLVKEMLPLYNRRLRKINKYTAIIKSLDEDDYAKLSIEPLNLEETQDLSNIYGVFETRGKAKTRLLDYQKTFSLCPKMLGLEKAKGACFQYQLGKCDGACIHKVPAQKHNLRVDLALARTKLDIWPYEGAMVVQHKGQNSGIVIDQWRVLGSYDESGELEIMTDSSPEMFDLDSYKIINNYLRVNKSLLNIFPLKSLNIGF